MLPSNLKALKTNAGPAGGVEASGLGVAVTGAAPLAGSGAGVGVAAGGGGFVACTGAGASSSVLAALAGLGGGNGGNLIHPSSVEAVTGGVLRAALGWSFCTLGADGPGRGGNCTHSSLPPLCACARQAAATSEPIRHDLRGGERKAVNRDGLKRSKKTFRAWRTSTENKIS